MVDHVKPEDIHPGVTVIVSNDKRTYKMTHRIHKVYRVFSTIPNGGWRVVYYTGVRNQSLSIKDIYPADTKIARGWNLAP